MKCPHCGFSFEPEENEDVNKGFVDLIMKNIPKIEEHNAKSSS